MTRLLTATAALCAVVALALPLVPTPDPAPLTVVGRDRIGDVVTRHDTTGTRALTVVLICAAVASIVMIVGIPVDEAGREIGVTRETTTTTSTTSTTTTTTTSTTAPSTTRPATSTTVAPQATAPAAAVEPSVGDGSCGGWRSTIAAHFPGEVGTACRVFIGCESGGDPNAVSATGDHGIAQINAATWNRPGHHDPVADWIGRHWHDVYDPDTNLAMAKRIRDAYGWRSWSCF